MVVELLVYSGVGNTAYLTGLFEWALRRAGHSVRSTRIEDLTADWPGVPCDVVGIGAPVYHTAPPSRLLETLESLDGRGRPLFTFWTKGLYAGNCARTFQRRAEARGFRPVANFEAVFPGVDFVAQTREGSRINLLLNLRVQRGLTDRVQSFCADLAPDLPTRIEARRWYAPLNEIPRRLAIPVYDHVKRKLSADEGKCTRGGWCVKHCPEQAIRPATRGVTIDPDRCTLCLRCYHACPAGAIMIGARARGRYRGPWEARNFQPLDGYSPEPAVCESSE